MAKGGVKAPKQPRIAFVAESWGSSEDEASKRAGAPRPLVGASGALFNTLLKSACGIDRRIVKEHREPLVIEQPSWMLCTNVFNVKPERNEVKRLFTSKKLSHKGDDRCKEWPALEKGRYLDAALLPEIDRLFTELKAFKPDVIVPLGNAALWALTRSAGIMAHRGCYHEAGAWTGIAGTPVIPTIHPAYVLRKFVWFILAVSDIRKAWKHASGELPLSPVCYIAEPTLDDVRRLLTMEGPLVVDLETRPSFRAISIIGIGNRDLAIAVPFVDDRKPGRNYWQNVDDEIEAKRICKQVLENKKTVKIGQNVMYELTWLREVAGIELSGEIRDSRLMHHALFPELPHDLGAITTSFDDILLPPWKSSYRDTKADS